MAGGCGWRVEVWRRLVTHYLGTLGYLRPLADPLASGPEILSSRLYKNAPSSIIGTRHIIPGKNTGKPLICFGNFSSHPSSFSSDREQRRKLLPVLFLRLSGHCWTRSTGVYRKQTKHSHPQTRTTSYTRQRFDSH